MTEIHWPIGQKRLYLGDIMQPDANSFGVLRLVMAMLVLISHAYLYTAGSSSAEPLTAWTGQSLGEHAVQGFFILSGILVAQSFERSRTVFDFAAARVLRIFPGLIVCVLLTALLLGPLVSQLDLSEYFSNTLLPAYLIKTLTLSTGNAPLPGVFESLPLAASVNTSLWTLKYEVLCYVMLALCGVAGLFQPRLRAWVAAAMLVIFATVLSGHCKDQETFDLIDNFKYFALFFGSGVLCYLVRDRLIISGLALIPLAAVFAASLSTCYAELGTALFLSYLIVWAASKTWGPLRVACNRADLSFGIYIYAGPVEQALIQGLPVASPLIIALCATVIAAPLALLSWVFVEHPALRLRSRLRTLGFGHSPRLKQTRSAAQKA